MFSLTETLKLERPELLDRLLVVWNWNKIKDQIIAMQNRFKVLIDLQLTVPWYLRPLCVHSSVINLDNGTTITSKKIREKSRECHNHKPQPFPDPKRKGKPTNPNKHKPNKRTKSTMISSLFPKRGNRNTKRTENTRTKWHTERHTTNRLVE